MFDLAEWKKTFNSWLHATPKVNHRPRGKCELCFKELSLRKDGQPMFHKCISIENIADFVMPNPDKHNFFGLTVDMPTALSASQLAIDPEVADMRANAGDYHNPTVIGEI
jgi:hypothetical protein